MGNRLSNMPGEDRPSVAPYDDNAKTLVNKVEARAFEKIKKQTGSRIDGLNEVGLKTENMLNAMKKTNEKLMQSKKVIANEGQAFERKNFVKLNVNKTGKYKPALRGAAFTNKMMSKKSNQMKFRGRQ